MKNEVSVTPQLLLLHCARITAPFSIISAPPSPSESHKELLALPKIPITSAYNIFIIVLAPWPSHETS